MKPPCEIVVWYVIPAIRSELAKDLLLYGMTQKEVSEMLDITQPAVSQYCTDKRGNGVKLSEEVKQSISNLARDLVDGTARKIDIVKRSCAICKQINTLDVIEQLGLNPTEFGDDCSSCISSKV